ncbi:MAG: hypothetical protein ACOYLF_17530, partial [Blastocatellia bacterium]
VICDPVLHLSPPSDAISIEPAICIDLLLLHTGVHNQKDGSRASYSVAATEETGLEREPDRL